MYPGLGQMGIAAILEFSLQLHEAISMGIETDATDSLSSSLSFLFPTKSSQTTTYQMI